MKPLDIKSVDWYHYNLLFFAEHLLGVNNSFRFLGAKRNNLYAKIDSYLEGKMNGNSILVDELSQSISKEDFIEKCYKSGTPKVFRGAAAHWPALKKWDLDFFEENYGNEKIVLNDNVGLADQPFEVLEFKDYIKAFKEGAMKYLRFSDIVNNHEELKLDFDMEWLRNYLYSLPGSWSEDAKMFVGRSGTLTPLHVGFSDFLFVQVSGRKKWILYPPNNRIFLDARTERTMYFYSKANPYDVENTDFPLFKYAEKYEVYLEPGDVLWVPSFFWHHVENLSESIGIRMGRTSIFSALKSSKVLTALFFLSTRPNILAHSLSLRSNKKELLFSKSQQMKKNR